MFVKRILAASGTLALAVAQELAASGLVVPGGKGYLGEDDIRTPYRGRSKPASQKECQPGSCPAARPW